jgi:hypothetical protein
MACTCVHAYLLADGRMSTPFICYDSATAVLSTLLSLRLALGTPGGCFAGGLVDSVEGALQGLILIARGMAQRVKLQTLLTTTS